MQRSRQWTALRELDENHIKAQKSRLFVHSEKSILSSCQVHQLYYLLVYSMKTLVLAFILFQQKCQQNKISN